MSHTWVGERSRAVGWGADQAGGMREVSSRGWGGGGFLGPVSLKGQRQSLGTKAVGVNGQPSLRSRTSPTSCPTLPPASRFSPQLQRSAQLGCNPHSIPEHPPPSNDTCRHSSRGPDILPRASVLRPPKQTLPLQGHVPLPSNFLPNLLASRRGSLGFFLEAD